MFAGYLKYQRLAMREDVLRFVPRLVTRLMAAGATSFLPRSSPFRRKMLHYGLNAPTTLTDMLLLGFHATDLRAASRGPLKAALQHYTPIDAIRPLLAKAPPEKVGLVNAMRYLDLKLTLAGDILVKVDRASMAVSLEVRPVYLHRDMLALAQRIPSNKLADRNHTKEALKLALRPWLPNSVLDRRKMGFAMPLRNWIRDDSTHLFSRNDGDDPLNDLLDSTLLQDALAAHRSGSRDLTSIIHSLLFLREWLGEWT